MQPRIPLVAAPSNNEVMWMDPASGRELPELRGRRLSYHDDWTNKVQGYARYANPLTGRGPCEGRPPGEFFAHQRWTNDPSSSNRDLFPNVGYLMSLDRSRRTPGTATRCPSRTRTPCGASAFASPVSGAMPAVPAWATRPRA